MKIESCVLNFESFSFLVKTQESRIKTQGSGFDPGKNLKIESCVLNLESFFQLRLKIQESRLRDQVLVPGDNLKIESCVLNLESFHFFSVKTQETRIKTQVSG